MEGCDATNMQVHFRGYAASRHVARNRSKFAAGRISAEYCRFRIADAAKTWIPVYENLFYFRVRNFPCLVEFPERHYLAH
jgi:hypothetical protein